MKCTCGAGATIVPYQCVFLHRTIIAVLLLSTIGGMVQPTIHSRLFFNKAAAIAMASFQPPSGSNFGPDHLKVMTAAFDDAWTEIQSSFADLGLKPEGARSRLANAIIAAAKEIHDDPVELKNAALRIMSAR